MRFPTWVDTVLMGSYSFAAYFADDFDEKENHIYIYKADIHPKTAQIELTRAFTLPLDTEQYFKAQSRNSEFTVEKDKDSHHFLFYYGHLEISLSPNNVVLSSNIYDSLRLCSSPVAKSTPRSKPVKRI